MYEAARVDDPIYHTSASVLHPFCWTMKWNSP